MKRWQIALITVMVLGIMGIVGGFSLPHLRYQSSHLNVNITDKALISKGE